MDKAFKSIKHGLEKDIKQYSHNMDKGLQLTDKDPERLFHLMGAMAFAKLLCMLEEMKEGGEKEGKGGMGGMLHAMGKQMGGGSHNGMQAMMNAIGLPPIPGFTGNDMNYSPENRRGAPGSGRHHMNYENNTYGEYDHMEPEDRHRSRRTGRFVRGEMDSNMTDNYDMDNRGGSSGGSSGGQGGNHGGTTGRR